MYPKATLENRLPSRGERLRQKLAAPVANGLDMAEWPTGTDSGPRLLAFSRGQEFYNNYYLSNKH